MKRRARTEQPACFQPLDLALLERLLKRGVGEFVRPRDVGGFDARRGSQHAKRLAVLHDRGLVNRESRHVPDATRARFVYAINTAGARFLHLRDRLPRGSTASEEKHANAT